MNNYLESNKNYKILNLCFNKYCWLLVLKGWVGEKTNIRQIDKPKIKIQLAQTEVHKKSDRGQVL